MIFVTLGSQKFQFNRLLIEIDKLVEKGIIKEEIFAQIGYSDYIPKNFQYKDFIDRNEYIKMEEKADLVITHGGVGAIVGSLKKGKKLIVVPREAKYGEHVDNHQFQILKEYSKLNLIEVCLDLKELGKIYQEIYYKEFTPYVSSVNRIIDSIENYINITFKM